MTRRPVMVPPEPVWEPPRLYDGPDAARLYEIDQARELGDADARWLRGELQRALTAARDGTVAGYRRGWMACDAQWQRAVPPRYVAAVELRGGRPTGRAGVWPVLVALLVLVAVLAGLWAAA